MSKTCRRSISPQRLPEFGFSDSEIIHRHATCPLDRKDLSKKKPPLPPPEEEDGEYDDYYA